MNLRETLARTTLLVGLDIFRDVSPATITDGLTATTVRLVADHATATSTAGQTALTSALVGAAQGGARIQLDIPEVEVTHGQPPLHDGKLAAALADLAGDLIQPAGRPEGVADIAFVFGKGAAGPAHEVLNVEADNWGCRLGGGSNGVGGDLPFGGLLAGVAVAAESMRCALRRLAASGAHPLPEHGLQMPGEIALQLPPLPSHELDLGAVDAISAGAITNAALFALLRWPGLSAGLRVIDDDIAAESNLNRYALLRRSDLVQPKVDVLRGYSTEHLAIQAVNSRYTDDTAAGLGPLAPMILVGVDDIPSRWTVARRAPGWLCVAGTTHFAVVVSEHMPGGPCAGCLHPRDDPGTGEIPTASFVSQLAGFLQAHRLLANGYGLEPAPPVLAAPFNLAAERSLTSIGLAARADCPVGCAASKLAQGLGENW
jgi:molybdopterin/thiamine biosynthesis adenylyltransferase